jgi:hypothetical protein
VVNITVPLTTLLRHAAATTDWTTRPDEDGGSPATGRAGTDHGSGTVEESFAWWWPLLGVDLGRLPGQVGRAGPVAAEQVVTAALQALAGGAPARWIVTGPSGTAWAATTPTHRRPKWLDHAIRTLDRTCRAPGCRRPAEACDIDHVIPYPRGATTATNLTALCRHHHRMKTHAGWSCRLLPDRRVEWVSPTGLTYTTHPGRWLPPLEPPNWLDFPDLPDEPSGAEAAEPPDRAPEVGNGSPAGTATADSGAPADQQEPPWLEACGPDTHPFLGVPTSLGVTDPDRWTDPDEWTDDPHGTTDELHGTHDLHSADERADFQGHHPDEWLPPPPWTPADPNAEDPLDQDPTDWRLYTTIFQ